MVNSIFTFPGGKHEQSITSLTLGNNTQKTVDTTVPAGERWLVLSIKVTNPDNVNRAVSIDIYKEAALTNFMRNLAYQADVAPNQRLQWPNFATEPWHNIQSVWSLVILETGNTISMKWMAGGASAGGTDADGIVIDYLKMVV